MIENTFEFITTIGHKGTCLNLIEKEIEKV